MVVLLSLALTGAYQVLPNFSGAEVSGRVVLSKAPPAERKIAVHKDQHACGDSQPVSTHVVGKKGELQNVVVEIVGIARGKAIEPTTVLVDQQKCRYVPRVTAFVVGSKVDLQNSDPTLHNTHTYLTENGDGGRTIFNLALPARGARVKKKIRDPGLIKYTCDAGHPWMLAWSYVAEHPYVAVTDADGRFSIGGVPAGTYTLRTWHEAEGEKETPLVVDSKGAADITVTY